jgi:hypothetical protein
MTTDESKAKSFGACVIFLAFTAVIVTAPWWAPIVHSMTEPKPIVVVECGR